MAGESPHTRALRGMLEVTRLVRTEEDKGALLDALARLVAEALGYQLVVINLYRPEQDDFAVSTVHGDEEARAALLGESGDWATWAPLLDARFHRRGAFFIPYDQFDWDSLPGVTYVPKLGDESFEDAWHPEDALMVPMSHTDGHLLGVLSVDAPASGRRPSDEELEILVAFADHAALAVQNFQEAAAAARHRAALEHLLRVSARLTESFSVETILGSVCDAIHSALGFQKVTIEMPDAETGVFHPRAAYGIALDDAAINTPYTIDDVRPLLDPAIQTEGTALLTPSEFRALLPTFPYTYGSVMNGRGPRAWNHHTLMVPLYGRKGEMAGLIWVDDPDDRLLPSTDTLQALRLFANQATTAIDTAAQFEEMRFLAEHDPMTRLHNRRAFTRRLAAEVTRSGRYGRPFALAVSDLNGFKSLNDRHGHPAGDEALERVGRVLAEVMRRADAAFRIGGDEFALLLVESSREQALAVVERVTAALRAIPDARFRGVELSFGIAIYPHDGGTPEELFRRADEAMYAAKRAGAAVRFAA